MAPSLRDRFQLVAMPAANRLAAFARDVAAGLTASPKTLPCCYFYDQEGSALFEDICNLPEYYLTRAEAEILQGRADEIAAELPANTVLVELGSGNASKTRLLIDAFLRLRRDANGLLRYVPVDICRTVLEDSSLELLRAYPRLEILAVAGEYHEGLRHLTSWGDRSKLILWLGSNIGNFERTEAARFLRRVRETMSSTDRLLVGIDLRKDRSVLEAAYDDSRGVTAEFNRNILARINRELDGHFDLDAFQHRAIYDERLGRIEMYLGSRCAQQVHIGQLGLAVSFEEGEAIHTENSYKYSPAEIEALAAAGGLRLQRQWFDGQRGFSESLLAPA